MTITYVTIIVNISTYSLPHCLLPLAILSLPLSRTAQKAPGSRPDQPDKGVLPFLIQATETRTKGPAGSPLCHASPLARAGWQGGKGMN